MLVRILSLAPVPGPVSGKRPRVDPEEKGIEIRHMVSAGDGMEIIFYSVDSIEIID
jgi:hypothetical protein